MFEGVKGARVLKLMTNSWWGGMVVLKTPRKSRQHCSTSAAAPMRCGGPPASPAPRLAPPPAHAALPYPRWPQARGSEKTGAHARTHNKAPTNVWIARTSVRAHSPALSSRTGAGDRGEIKERDRAA